MRAILFPLLFTLTMPLTSFAQAGTKTTIERGKTLYVKNMCHTCHGTVGNGGERTSGPPVAPNVWPLEAFRTQMRSPRQDMPRYGDKFLSDSDINDIHAWLSTIKGGPKAKDIPLLANM